MYGDPPARQTNMRIDSWFLRLWLLTKRRLPEILASTVKRPKWFVMFAFSRLHFVRALMGALSKPSAYQYDAKGHSVFTDTHVDDVVETLKKDGLYLGLSLSPRLVQEILDYAMNATYLGDGSKQFRFSLATKGEEEARFGRRFAVGYDLCAALNCPTVRKLKYDPKLWAIATQYLECQPLLFGVKIWWTFVVDPDAMDESKSGFYRFHFDLEDYQSLKFLFYLTNVDLSSGPHCCVRGSHRKKKLRHQFSLSREANEIEILDYYGEKKVITICEKAGFGFAEDPFCFHKGILPVNRNRAVLEILFGRTDLGSL